MALFLPVPWLASYGAHVDFTASVLIVTAVVNLHHFMIDGVVWKLRDPRVARTLTDATTASDPPPSPASSSWWRYAAGGLVAIALVSLAALDQWRYRLALDGADPAALQAAARVNPFDSAVQGRLLRVLVERGDDEALRAHLDETLARNPADIDARVNAGVLARRQGRPADAERHWTEALARVPGLTPLQLYLAELLDERQRPSDAARHYRAYLEQVVASASDTTPDPAVVIPVVLKFGDALDRAGQPAAARTQFELAATMARRTGLADLEAAARERLR
jgi:tetratricopeptide (TPR) repeat protein